MFFYGPLLIDISELDVVWSIGRDWLTIRTDGQGEKEIERERGAEGENEIMRVSKAVLSVRLYIDREIERLIDLYIIPVPLAEIMKSTRLKNISLVFFFNIAVNELITAMTQNILNSIDEHFHLIKYSLSKFRRFFLEIKYMIFFYVKLKKICNNLIKNNN